MLDNHAYLYEDLKSDDPTKAFHSVFITYLLAETHVSSIKWWWAKPAKTA